MHVGQIMDKEYKFFLAIWEESATPSALPLSG